MSGHSHEALRRIFELALAAPADQRGALLDRECRNDPELRKRIETMVKAEEDSRFLAAPTLDLQPAGSPATPTAGWVGAAPVVREQPGTRIGPYKLLQVIGEGGFGTVFMAEQEKPVSRKVALKIIKLGMDTGQVVARFEQERQALAIMDHANIAKVFDAGATDTGRPFFVMELCTGVPISDYCDKHNLSIPARLELFAQICQAVQHAHTKGIIHRDIKPSNVLVSTQDGRPQAKVIDFGIAKATASKLTEKTLFTEHRQLIGTPEYMSPEQAEGSLDIDTRTDVYSLGVLLYELLTGSTPFSSKQLRSAAFGEIQRIIREVDPPKPSTRLSQSAETMAGIAASRQVEPRKLGAIVRGELDWIVMKALEKDRSRRYETANGLGLDIRRYLAGEAVVAAPPSGAYRMKKFVRRNKGAVTAVAAVAAALLIGVVAFAWQARVAVMQRDRAVLAEAESSKRAGELKQVSEFQAKMLSEIDATEAGMDLMADIRAKFAAALEKSSLPEQERTAREEAFARELFNVNATDTASEMIDRTILKPAVKAVDSQFKEQPVVDASLRHTLAGLYSTLGMTDEALKLEEAALATRERVLGPSHADTLLSVNDVGSLLEYSGKVAEAEAFYTRAFEGRKSLLGEDDPETLTTMGNLGNYYRGMGKFAEAEPLLRAVVDKNRKVRGNENRDTLISLNTLGYWFVSQGNYAETEPLWREAYETGRRVFGAEDRDVLVWTANLGGLLQIQRKMPEAEALFREALAATRRKLGEEHPSTIHAISALGEHMNRRGMLDEAELLFREALEKSERTNGPEHPDTMSCMQDMANLLFQRGKLAEADTYLTRVLESFRRLYGPSHPDTLIALGQVARLRSRQGNTAEAETLYREALKASSETVGKEHPDTLIFMTNLGGVLIAAKKLDEAKALIQEVIEIRLRVSGEDHPETLIARTNLARIHELQGNSKETEAIYRDLESRFRRAMGDEHPNTLNAITNLANVLRTNGKEAEAEPLFREGLAGNEKKFGKDNLRTADARWGLGKTLRNLGRFTEAETELLEADRVVAAAEGASATRRSDSADSIAQLYEKWNAAEPEKGYEVKAAEWKQKAEALKPAAAP